MVTVSHACLKGQYRPMQMMQTRLGQYRPIKITRLIIENSIESRIIQLQEKKKALFQSTVGKDMAALDSAWICIEVF